MNTATVIALASVGITVLTIVLSVITAGRGASRSYVGDLEAKTERQRLEIGRLENRVKDLEAENLHLMRKLMANGGRA